jgi:hypothetical protein
MDEVSSASYASGCASPAAGGVGLPGQARTTVRERAWLGRFCASALVSLCPCIALRTPWLAAYTHETFSIG